MSDGPVIVTEEASRYYGAYWEESLDPTMDSVDKKQPEHCLALALPICAFWEKQECTAEMMIDAIDAAVYFRQHHKKAEGESLVSQEAKKKNAILAWAERNGIKAIRARHLQMARLPGCGSALEAKTQMQELVDLDHAKWTMPGKEIELLDVGDAK